MQFFIPRKQKPIVPIIPLLDILAILLIFFILTTSFNAEKPFLRVSLPEVTNLETESDHRQRVPLSVLASGEIRLGDQSMVEAELTAALRKMKTEQPESELELNMDEDIPLKTVLSVWESLTVAGYPVREVPTRVQVKPALIP